MEKTPFIHLHTHSHYSLLDGLSKVPEMVALAEKYHMPALGLTDHGNMHGAIEFYKECKKRGVKPIIGVEAYITPGSRHDKRPGIDTKRFHLTLLAKDNTGYRNLIKLVTASYLEGYYYKPRMDKELLREHSEGIIALSGCFGGELSRALRAGDDDAAREIIAEHQDIFGKENYFLEIMHHPGVEGIEEVRKKIIALSEETGIPLIATQDSHYLHPEDQRAHETLLAVQTNADLSNSDRFSMSSDDYSFIDTPRAYEYFSDTPEAVANTKMVADMCNVELELGTWVFPDLRIPEGATYDAELARLARAGIPKRGLSETKEVVERMEYELDIIKKKGYSPYFLVVADLLRFAHENGIFTNIRGSVAGSLVTYLTGITNINPLEYKLPFERFLNPERPSAPDIDMDFADNRRDEVIEYARRKYGKDKVAQIGTFGTMLAKGSVRDVARALGHPYAVGDKIANLIPFGSQGFPMTIDRAMELEPELADLYKKDAATKEIIDLARRLEGCVRHVSVHAAGVVISPTALTDFVPLQLDPRGGKIITQYDMHAVEDAGLLKFDFLGIRNLAILENSVRLVEKRHGKKVDIEHIPLDDADTFRMLARGETMGVFQLSGSGMTKWLKELKPSTIHDINAMVALYRPGPMELIPEYIQRKHNPSLVSYLDPRMKDILDQSYGVITYQDDVLLIAIKLAGYSWLEADQLRKAMGKKIPEVMAAQEEKFISGCVDGGMSPSKALALWKLIEPFAAYGFNKCLPADTRIIRADTGVPTPVGNLFSHGKGFPAVSMGKSLSLKAARASAPFENGKKKVYRLTTRSGMEIRATSNHPFLTFFGWKTLGKLRKGERVAAARIIPEPKKTAPLPAHKAATLGYVISEGNLCHPHGVYFYSSSDDEIADFMKNARRFPNTALKINGSKSATSVYVGKKEPQKENGLRSWLSSLGVMGKKAPEKIVPDAVFSAPNSSVAVFLGKLWQGDGSVSEKNDQTYYATSSRRLADDVRLLLLRFGIVSSLHRKTFSYRGGGKKGYTVCVTGRDNIARFSKEIARHMIGKKKDALRRLAQKTKKRTNNLGRGTTDTVPADIFETIREEMRRKGISGKELAKKTGLSERIFFNDAQKRGFTRETLEKIGKELGSSAILRHARSDIFWDEVVSVRAEKTEMTYDVTVPDFENFVAEGFIVHNSHAASYGRLAYQTAYMKANFPVEYMTAVLSADAGEVEKIAEIIAECTRMGIRVLPPDVNASFSDFTVVSEKEIRFGLYSVKNLGSDISDAIIKEREERGPFESFADFLERVQHKNLNKKSLEALVMSGAMDALGERGAMLGNMEEALNYHKECSSGPQSQESLFAGMAKESVPQFRMKEVAPATAREKLAWEKELLGLYVSGHPLDEHKDKLAKLKADIATVREKARPGMPVVVAGIIEDYREITTKNGERMAFLKISDFSGALECVVFPKSFLALKDVLAPDACVAVKGRVSDRRGDTSIIIEAAKAL